MQDLDNVEPWFWDVIDQAGRSSDKLRELLRKMSRQELERFHSQFAWAMAELAADDIRDVTGYTRDEMQDVAGWVTSQGRDYYARVYDNPAEFPRLEDIDNNNLEGVAYDVYWERFGVSMPGTG